MNPEISLIIATYNEADNVGLLIDKLQEHTKDLDCEYIVVDDNSPDGTADVVRASGKKYGNVRVIVRTNERGLASALIRGFNEAKGKYIFECDADLSHDPKHFPQMLSLIKEGKADFIIGSRYMKGAKMIGKPWIKLLASRVAQVITWCILWIFVSDMTNNFRMWKREVFDSIKDKMKVEGNAMLIEFVYRAKKAGYTIYEIPTIFKERERGQTKLSLPLETWRFIKAMLKIRFT